MRPAERLRQLLGRPRLLVAGTIVLQWLTCLVVGLRADSVDFGAASLLNVVVLGPIALVCAFRIAAGVGGVALGAWTLLVWVALPWLAPAFTLASYDATLRDQVLPLVLGLTGEAGYAGGVAFLIAVALLQQWGRPGTVLSLLLVAVAGAILLWSAPDLSLDALQRNGTTCGICTSNAEATVRRVLGAERAGIVSLYECGADLFEVALLEARGCLCGCHRR